jgi:hypothetical protein
MKRNMMATKAFSKTNFDISRDKPDLAYIDREDDDNYYGRWAASMIGFINVRFPKDTTRELTSEERDFFKTQVVEHSSGAGSHPALVEEYDTEPNGTKAWDFPLREGESLMDIRVKDAASMALGGASMCWVGGTGSLEFDSSAATDISDKLNTFLREKRKQDLRRFINWAVYNGLVGYNGNNGTDIAKRYIEEVGEL